MKNIYERASNMHKLYDAFLARGETEDFAEDAVGVMIECVCNDGDSLRQAILREGFEPTEELIDELCDLCEEYQSQ